MWFAQIEAALNQREVDLEGFQLLENWAEDPLRPAIGQAFF